MADSEYKTLYRQLTPQTARQMMCSIDTYTAIVDVRRPAEFCTGHIKGAVNIPLSRLKEDARKLLPDLSQEIILYCRTGSRSLDAAYTLIDMGYTNVFDLGAVTDWCYGLETS